MSLVLLAACGGSGTMNAANTAGSSASAGMPSAAGMSAAGMSVAGMSAAGSAAGTPSTSTGIEPSFATLKLVLGGGGGIMPCAAAPCHGVNGMAPPSKPLELPPTDDAKLYANLTSYVSAACNNLPLVSPGNPARSALVTILKGPCGKTPRMPYGCSAEAGDCIPDEYIAAVERWIERGAPK
ncbi:MAG TPA: hypothetical protein VJR89_09245 [Polyangiales bacterium]|nr:hypothetical protein [Polyangiales bacterium]